VVPRQHPPRSAAAPRLQLAGAPQTTVERLTVPGSVLGVAAHGVYRMAGAPEPDHLALRAAWLQLEPGVWAWGRTPAQTRRPDVRLHLRSLPAGEWVLLSGLPVTRPAWIASDLLEDHEDPEAAAQIVADALRGNYDDPGVKLSQTGPRANSDTVG